MASKGVATHPSLIFPLPAQAGRDSIVPFVRNKFVLMQKTQPACTPMEQYRFPVRCQRPHMIIPDKTRLQN